VDEIDISTGCRDRRDTEPIAIVERKVDRGYGKLAVGWLPRWCIGVDHVHSAAAGGPPVAPGLDGVADPVDRRKVRIREHGDLGESHGAETLRWAVNPFRLPGIGRSLSGGQHRAVARLQLGPQTLE
jgi:hypothetical protein